MTAAHVHTPALGRRMCLTWINERTLCCLPTGHQGEHITMPRIPHPDINPHNPGWTA